MSKENKTGIFYIKVFLIFFSLVFAAAVTARLYSSYTNSNFSDNSFNLLIIADNYIGVIGLDEGEKKIYSAIVTEELEEVRRRNTMIQSINFGIPVHAYIEFPEGVEASPPTKSFFSFTNIQTIISRLDVKKEGISLFDWVKIYRLVESSPEETVIRTYASINDLAKLLPNEDENFFRNSDIANRKTSLQVINATNINGLGNRVGNMFSRFGFNVVAVNTSGADKSEIYYTNEDYKKDAEILSKSFKFPVVLSSEYQVADVTIVIGEDSELLLEDIAN